MVSGSKNHMRSVPSDFMSSLSLCVSPHPSFFFHNEKRIVVQRFPIINKTNFRLPGELVEFGC